MAPPRNAFPRQRGKCIGGNFRHGTRLCGNNSIPEQYSYCESNQESCAPSSCTRMPNPLQCIGTAAHKGHDSATGTALQTHCAPRVGAYVGGPAFGSPWSQENQHYPVALHCVTATPGNNSKSRCGDSHQPPCCTLGRLGNMINAPLHHREKSERRAGLPPPMNCRRSLIGPSPKPPPPLCLIPTTAGHPPPPR